MVVTIGNNFGSENWAKNFNANWSGLTFTQKVAHVTKLYTLAIRMVTYE